MARRLHGKCPLTWDDSGVEPIVVAEPERICRMKALHNLAGVSVTFDEDRLVPNAGLVAPALLVQRLGIARLVDARVKLTPGVGAAFCGAKAATVLGAMLAGGDSIDDVDVLRAGAAGELFNDTRAPSAIGTWLRAFTWSNVRQFDAVGREALLRGWAAGLGPADLAAPLTVDVDSTVCQTYGTKKQGARFGYTKVRDYHPVLAACADTGEVLHARMRGGNAASARGAKTFLAETLSRVRVLPVAPSTIGLLTRSRTLARASPVASSTLPGFAGGHLDEAEPPAPCLSGAQLLRERSPAQLSAVLA